MLQPRTRCDDRVDRDYSTRIRQGLGSSELANHLPFPRIQYVSDIVRHCVEIDGACRYVEIWRHSIEYVLSTFHLRSTILFRPGNDLALIYRYQDGGDILTDVSVRIDSPFPANRP
jgi:hypothetical protein